MAFGKAMLDLISTDLLAANNHARTAELRVLLAAPRGFCAGVTRAIDAVRDALAKHGRPVYVRRPIVHNLEVVRSLEAEGAVFVEELDQVPAGSVVMFSAHGVSPSIASEARSRGLTAYDAVCPLVAKVHREVERHRRSGRAIILVGHRGHPEIEGTLGHIEGGQSFVVNSAAEVAALPLHHDTPAAYAIQTTFSVSEARQIVTALREKFRELAGPSSSDICYATTNRQEAVAAIAKHAQSFIIVGESFSSNARRLAEVAAAHCSLVQLVSGPEEIDWNMIPQCGVLGISAAASTPEVSVRKVIGELSRKYAVSVDEIMSSQESAVFKPLAIS